MPFSANLTVTTTRGASVRSASFDTASARDAWLAATPLSPFGTLLDSTEHDLRITRTLIDGAAITTSDQGYAVSASECAALNGDFSNYVPPIMIAFGPGQSNEVGEGLLSDLPGVAPNLGTSTLNTNFSNAYIPVTPAVEPIDSGTGQLDGVSLDGAQVGPMLSMIDTISASKSQRVVAIPCPKSATLIASWLPGGSGHEDRTTLYGSLLHRIKTAQTLFRTTLSAVVGYIGETDSAQGNYNAAAYKANYQAVIDNLRTDLGLPNLAAFIVILPPTTAEPNWQSVRTQQAALAQSSPLQVAVQAPDGPWTDGTFVHLTTAAQVTLGQSLGNAFLAHF